MSRAISLQTPTVLWQGGGNITLSYSMYMGLMMLGREKLTQQKHWCLRQVLWGWVGYWKVKKSHI